MKIEIMQKNYVAKEKLLDLITKKVQKFDKYIAGDADAKVVLSKAGQTERYKLEISIKAKNIIVRSEVESDNMYANLDTCLSKIERQIVRISDKKKYQVKNVDPMDLLFFDTVPAIEPAKIIKHKEFELDRLTEDQAIDELELVGNDFYIY